MKRESAQFGWTKAAYIRKRKKGGMEGNKKSIYYIASIHVSACKESEKICA